MTSPWNRRSSVRRSTTTKARSIFIRRRVSGRNRWSSAAPQRVTVLLRPASPGRCSALVALVAAVVTGAGVALATPVPVLTVSDGTTEFVRALDRTEPLQYSYRTSIYEVTLYQPLAREANALPIQPIR